LVLTEINQPLAEEMLKSRLKVLMEKLQEGLFWSSQFQFFFVLLCVFETWWQETFKKSATKALSHQGSLSES
jgi:hypothetical protein